MAERPPWEDLPPLCWEAVLRSLRSNADLKFRALRVLVLSKIRLLGDDVLVLIAEYFPLLEELDISCPRLSRFTDDGISVLSQKLQRLSRIDVSRNSSVSDQSLVVLSVNCPSLREIRFWGCGFITGRGIAKLMKNRPDLVSLAPTCMEKERIFCEELVDSFRRARGLSRLDFSGSFIWDGLLMSVAEANIPLEHLVLSSARGFSFDGIQRIMLKHRGIKVLDLEEVDFLTDRDLSVICRDLPSLTSINVRHCFNLTRTTLDNLTRRCPFLKGIVMDWTNLRMDDADETDLVSSSQVRSLCIAGSVNLTDECLKKIGRMCPDLRYLDVSGCLKITGDGISGVLKCCPEIKNLVIHGLENLGNLCIDFDLPQLEGLHGKRLELSDEQLVGLISRCCNLKRLDLPKCMRLSTKGVEKVVENCKTLKEINLRNCHDVRDDVPFLDWMLSVRPSLRRILPPRRVLSSEIEDHFLQRGCLVRHY